MIGYHLRHLQKKKTYDNFNVMSLFVVSKKVIIEINILKLFNSKIKLRVKANQQKIVERHTLDAGEAAVAFAIKKKVDIDKEDDFLEMSQFLAPLVSQFLFLYTP